RVLDEAVLEKLDYAPTRALILDARKPSSLMQAISMVTRAEDTSSLLTGNGELRRAEQLVDGFGIYTRGKSGLLLRIPPEILIEILSLCCSSGSDLIPGPQAELPPLILSRVSRYWRKLVLSTPRLWSQFALDIGYCKPELLSCYLERSDPALLDIQCSDLSGSDPPSFCADKDAVIYALLSHSKRWRSATLDLYSPREWKRALRAFPYTTTSPPSFPNLEALALWGRAFFTKGPEQDILHRLFPAPQPINSVSMAFYQRKPRSDTYIPINLHPESLTLDDPFREIGMLEILYRFPQVQELIIPYYALTWSSVLQLTIKPENRFRHEFLTRLSVRFCVGDEDEFYSPYWEEGSKYSLYLLFRTVTLPALKQLAVHRHHSQMGCQCRCRHQAKTLVWSWDSDGFKEMIERSRCTLDRLVLLGIPLRPSEMKRIVLTCSALTTFVYHEDGGMEATKELLDLLSERLLPVLRYLGISVVTSEEEEELKLARKFVEVLEARRRMGLPALELSLDLRRPLSPSTREILDGMSREAISSVLVSVD
ncbi:hypothetical protein V5O48_017430, partial [Marasmius crinis-equi]